MVANNAESTKQDEWSEWGNGLVPGLLKQAEENFGARLQGWDFQGVTFQKNGPHIFFPLSSNGNVIKIALDPDTVGYPDRFLYQLSHEVIHLLAPNESPPTIMLEEGVAVYFSLHFPQFRSADYKNVNISRFDAPDGPVNYRDAYKLYLKLIDHDPDAVKKLRAGVPEFYNMKPDYLVNTLGINHCFADALCERRQMR